MGTHLYSLKSNLQILISSPYALPFQTFKMDQQNDQNNEERMARTIFARNISFNATIEDLKNIPEFQSALDVKLPTDRETGRCRGFGFIEFATPEECQQALANA